MSAENEPVFLVEIQPGSGRPLHEQLESRLREQIREGRLPADTRLPSSRALARQLKISRGVVLEAYAQLQAEGYLTASQGSRTRVAAAATVERPPVPAVPGAPRHACSFDPCLPDLSAFPRESWQRASRSAMAGARFEDFGQPDARGAAELRNELMSYLARARGAAAEPEHTLICAGFTQGLSLICAALRDRGVERIAVEEPGWHRHRLIAERAGIETVPVPVDEQGIDVEALRGCSCEVVVVSPAHQFPTGAVLSPARRAALLEWAEDEDALVVEDDYDSELRYDRDPVGALQGLAPERVAHVGSVSKRLAPALRIGWILSPSWLTGTLTYDKSLADGGCEVPAQLTLARFIARGDLDRHLRRMRLRYRERRSRLLESIAQLIPQARAGAVAAGLFELVTVPGDVGAAALTRAAAGRGVAVEALALSEGRLGLVLGFANLSEEAIEKGVELLAEALRGEPSA